MTSGAPPPPFRIERSAAAPLAVFDSPHSGRFYPASFATVASPRELRWAEDAYVDDLLEEVPALGIALLAANYPRAYVDLNRAADDIDGSMLDAPWPGPLAPTAKSALGLGLVRRFVVPGVPIYGAPLPVAEVRRRIDEIHAPYQHALDALIAETLAARGVVWHLNWHSMKSRGNAMTPDGPGAARADFVVSDRDGASAAPAVTALVAETLRGLGYSVSVNVPYKGGEIVRRVGNPARGVHSVQVEINRRLYLDEAEVCATPESGILQHNMTALASTIARQCQLPPTHH